MRRIISLFSLLLIFQIVFSQDQAVQMGNTGSILMVLDVQEHFVDNAMKKKDGKELVENINTIIQIARPMDIVFVKANIELLELSFKGIKVVHAEDMDLAPALYRKKNDRIFIKEEGSAFSSGEFREYLEASHIGTVYLVGLFASKCISATAINGEERGYEMILIEDGVAAKKASKKEKILGNLLNSGVKIISAAEFEKQVE